MNKEELKGKWNQLKGSIKSRWGKFSDDDIQRIEGEKDKLVGKVQEKYGRSREEAEKEVDDFTTRH
ncbi:MAG: CsbD family protein [Desulfuromonadales bacterium]